MLGRILELHGYVDIVGTNCRDNTGIFKRSSRGLLVNSFHTWTKKLLLQMISIKKEGLDKFRITTEMIVKMLQGPQIMTRGLQKGKINI